MNDDVACRLAAALTEIGRLVGIGILATDPDDVAAVADRLAILADLADTTAALAGAHDRYDIADPALRPYVDARQAAQATAWRRVGHRDPIVHALDASPPWIAIAAIRDALREASS